MHIWRRPSPFHGAVTDSGHTETKKQPEAEHANRAVQYLRREQMESAGHLELGKAATTSRVNGDTPITHTAPGSVVSCKSARHVQVADRGVYSHLTRSRVLATAVRSGVVMEKGRHPKRSPNRREGCLRNLTPMRSPATASAAGPYQRPDEGEMRVMGERRVEGQWR